MYKVVCDTSIHNMEYGAITLYIAQRLFDKGYHDPTVYFPLDIL